MLGFDAIKQYAGRFVVRVLRYQLTAECLRKDALGQAVNARLSYFDADFQLADEGEKLFDTLNDFDLFSCGRKTDLEDFQKPEINPRPCCTMDCFSDLAVGLPSCQ